MGKEQVISLWCKSSNYLKLLFFLNCKRTFWTILFFSWITWVFGNWQITYPIHFYLNDLNCNSNKFKAALFDFFFVGTTCKKLTGILSPYKVITGNLLEIQNNISIHLETYFFHILLFICPFVCFLGVHRDLYSWDGAEADCHGSLLLLPTGLEYLWWRHCLPQSDGVGSLKCGGAVCPAIFQTGNINL